MKIALYLDNKLMEFFLPTQVSGSFSFDENPDTISKLINIEGVDNKWILYSTEYSKVISDNSIVNEIELSDNAFYYIQRDNQMYLIYVSPIYDNTILPYHYETGNLNILINPQGNIRYEIPFVKDVSIAIAYINNQIYLNKKGNGYAYINKKAIEPDNILINNGDVLDLYGLSICFLQNILLINNPKGLVVLQPETIGIIKNKYNYSTEELKNEDLIDEDMYTSKDYYSKSPRIRRTIESKEITIDPPPPMKDPKEIPTLLVLGPMLTMGLMSLMTLLRTINNIALGKSTLADSWPQLIIGVAMLTSTLVWPRLTKAYQKHVLRIETREHFNKYNKYLESKARELEVENSNQKEILKENLLELYECLNIMNRKGLNFWDKRIDQNDFLVARIGIGNEDLDVKLSFLESDFEIDDNILKDKASAIIENYKYIKDAPIGYSFQKNKTTAIMGSNKKSCTFINNIILQFITFYSYDDLKIAVFTNHDNLNYFEYIKYLNHNFTNDKSFRLFSTDQESAKRLAEFITLEANNRLKNMTENGGILKPYYLIIIDEYDTVRKFDIINTLIELDANIGFSIIILENHLNKLPSKCNNFILLGDKTSEIMTNSFNMQQKKKFFDEVKYDINMKEVTKILANIPVELSEGVSQLPTSCTFLEMEKVGKVEQLNILNRWNTSDSTTSLKAEIGIDEQGELIYLDLHEKAHGPHGLIAGMTGSGKSEFIITYILSMAINYSPDEVAFILIDYKGGGLAYAFENKTTGMTLPHLAGTITNLDKSEMSRTLVSIDSEVKRRQKLFNDARDALGESTIDIYKYQKNYQEGRLQEPCPHLFIICDEFAELKAQQPEFMLNLISIARIGRSLGVHLILATQKPSGVVNDQIWSNTKFRVCLKVQDASDSKEMLKRPEAAMIKEAGRFYLQVGYDELFLLGQSGWAGAKYFPSNTIVKEEDKSVNIINDNGVYIKSLKAGNNKKVENQGEQLSAIMKNIIEISNNVNKKTKRLWLDNIPAVILIDDLMKKYNYSSEKYKVKGIIGEYDAPENQEQGLLEMNYLKAQNTLIFGTEEAEREQFIKTLIYSTSKNHDADEINYYILDYGSESLGIFEEFPQVGEVCFATEDEKFRNIFKLIKKELKTRKKEFLNLGGDYKSYIKNSPEKKPLIVLVINNMDSLLETKKTMIETLIPIARECARYGIYIWMTLSAMNIIGRRLLMTFTTTYCLHVKDPASYRTIIPAKSKVIPNDCFARGIVNNNGVHEFQTASIIKDEADLNKYLQDQAKEFSERNSAIATPIPKLPTKVTFDLISSSIKTIKDVPIGISRDSLEIVKYDFTAYDSTVISGFKIQNINNFMLSLIKVFKKISGLSIIALDMKKILPELKELVNNYYDSEAEKTIEMLLEFMQKRNENKETTGNIIFIVYGMEALKNSLPKTDKLATLFKEIKKDETSRIIACDGMKGMKATDMELWYTPVRNISDGIWIGRGFTDQQQYMKASNSPRDTPNEIKKNYGYCVTDQFATLMKCIDFSVESLEEDEDDEE